MIGLYYFIYKHGLRVGVPITFDNNRRFPAYIEGLRKATVSI